MAQSVDDAATGDTLEAIRDLLARTVDLEQVESGLEEELAALARRRTESTTELVSFASSDNQYSRQRTDMAAERTALTREQTRLSTRSTELGNLRTELSRERTGLAGQRTDLSVRRTDMARARTNLAGQRTLLSRQRTDLAAERNRLAEGRTRFASRRTHLSSLRTELAWGRTYLAFIRTGLAFLALGISLFRYFGLNWWTVFDGGLALASLIVIAWAGRGYYSAHIRMKRLSALLRASEEPVPARDVTAMST